MKRKKGWKERHRTWLKKNAPEILEKFELMRHPMYRWRRLAPTGSTWRDLP